MINITDFHEKLCEKVAIEAEQRNGRDGSISNR